MTEGTPRCPLRGETRPRVVVRERASRAPSKSTSTGPPPRATKLADRASVTRNRRNTQVLRAQQKQLTLSVYKKKKIHQCPSRRDPEKLVVPAQHPDADARAGFGARGQAITYHQAG